MLARYYATHNPRGWNGTLLGESNGDVMISPQGWWFHPEGTQPAYGYFVQPCDTVRGGRIPALDCGCSEANVCERHYDEAYKVYYQVA